MSSTLSWRPVDVASDSLSTGTKFLIRELRGGGDIYETLREHDIVWLRALKAGRDPKIVADIDALIAAIEKHGALYLYEEWL